LSPCKNATGDHVSGLGVDADCCGSQGDIPPSRTCIANLGRRKLEGGGIKRPFGSLRGRRVFLDIDNRFGHACLEGITNAPLARVIGTGRGRIGIRWGGMGMDWMARGRPSSGGVPYLAALGGGGETPPCRLCTRRASGVPLRSDGTTVHCSDLPLRFPGAFAQIDGRAVTLKNGVLADMPAHAIPQGGFKCP